jgi:hypothetical protein
MIYSTPKDSFPEFMLWVFIWISVSDIFILSINFNCVREKNIKFS